MNRDYTRLVQERGKRNNSSSASTLYDSVKRISIPVGLAMAGLGMIFYGAKNSSVNEETLKEFNREARAIEIIAQRAHNSQSDYVKNDLINQAADMKNTLRNKVSRGYVFNNSVTSDYSLDNNTRLSTQRLDNMWVLENGTVKEDMIPYVYSKQNSPSATIKFNIPNYK